jgi:hypothetical protein
MAMTATGTASMTAQAPAASRGCLLTTAGPGLLSIFTGSPSNRRNFGPKWTASPVFEQAEIDCFVVSYKRSFF